MLRRFASAAVVLFVLAGFALAGDYSGTITSITKDEVKFTTGGKKKKGEDKTLKVGKKVTITKKDEAVTVDQLSEMIKDSKKAKGVRAKITTEGEDDKEVVTKILILVKKPK